MPVPAEAEETYSACVWVPRPQQDCLILQDVCLCLECQLQIHLPHLPSSPGTERQSYLPESHIFIMLLFFFESQRSEGTFLSNLKGLPKVCTRLGCSGSASLRGDGQCFKKS